MDRETYAILTRQAHNLPRGYTARPARWDDLQETVALFNACSQRLIGVDEFTVDSYRNEWQSPGFELEKDARMIVAPDGSLAAYVEVFDLVPHVRVYTWGRVHPRHQGRGLSAHLLAWAEERARQAVAKAPQGARVVALNGVLGADRGAQAALRSAGFQPVRHSWRMAIDLNAAPPAAEWPAGVAVRTLLRGRDERLMVQAVRDAFRDHWGHVDRPFEFDMQHWLHHMDSDRHFDPALFFLAMAGEQVAGISLCRSRTDEDADMGWVSTLGVLRPWRRQGLGLALLRHSFGEFYRRGKLRAGLGVDAQSLTGATRLYEKAGMHVAREYRTFEKELRPGVEISTQAL